MDTTNPKAHAKALSLLSQEGATRAFELASGLRVHLYGMYFCNVGPEWDSERKSESDFLHHIAIGLSGRRQVIHGSRILEMEPGMAYFLPANTPVGRRFIERGEVLYIKFRCEWIPGVDPLMDWTERTPTRIGRISAKEWRRCLDPGWRNNSNNLLRLHGQLEIWLADILPSMNKLISHHLKINTKFKAVYAKVEACLGADMRVSEMAKSFGTTVHSFSTSFASATKVTPKEYLNRRLNQEAVRLLIETDLAVKEIAERLRFSDQFYFSRFFQKMNRVSPSRYRTMSR